MSMVFLPKSLLLKSQEMLLTEHGTRWRRFRKPSEPIDVYLSRISGLGVEDLQFEFSLIHSLIIVAKA